jgi:anaphase-promoting complex subunit 6
MSLPLTSAPDVFSNSSASHVSSPSGSRNRLSLSSSFSFGPQPLVSSYIDANASTASIPKFFGLDPNRSVLPSSPLRSSPRHPRRAKESASRHPLANDTTDVFQDSEDDADDESEYEWGMIDRMRLWRHDALMQHLYETAAFWGDKILSWTSELYFRAPQFIKYDEISLWLRKDDPNDAFWLAQTYFMTHQYSRAERLLTRPFPTSPPKPISMSPPLTNGHHSRHPSTKGKGREMGQPPMTSMPRLPLGPGGMIEIPEDMQDGVSRLVDMSVACRYLAAQCLVCCSSGV